MTKSFKVIFYFGCKLQFQKTTLNKKQKLGVIFLTTKNRKLLHKVSRSFYFVSSLWLGSQSCTEFFKEDCAERDYFVSSLSLGSQRRFTFMIKKMINFKNYLNFSNLCSKKLYEKSKFNLKPERIIVFSRSFQLQKKIVIIYVLILPQSTQGRQRNLW
jgi:hypothetical protein